MANNDYEIVYSNKKDSIIVKENVIDNDSLVSIAIGCKPVVGTPIGLMFKLINFLLVSIYKIWYNPLCFYKVFLSE